MSGKTFGDWNKVKQKHYVLRNGLTKTASTLMRSMGRKYLDTVIKHIEKQDFSFPPLAVATVERKGHGKAWIDSERFKKKLSIIALTDKKRDVRIASGAFGNTPYKGDITMYQIAVWGEFGAKGQPARPVFTQTLKAMKDEVPHGLKMFVEGVWRF